jgi:hypothetical protein
MQEKTASRVRLERRLSDFFVDQLGRPRTVSVRGVCPTALCIISKACTTTEGANLASSTDDIQDFLRLICSCLPASK